ncbi:hypothetical protein F5887DRAFT_964039, partial [Amanita rubescens]
YIGSHGTGARYHADPREDMTSNAQAAIIAMTIEALLTGVQFFTLILCMTWQLHQDERLTPRRDIHWSLMIIAILIFVFSVTDLSVSLGTTLLALSGGSTLLTSGIIVVCNFPVQKHPRYLPGLALFCPRCCK